VRPFTLIERPEVAMTAIDVAETPFMVGTRPPPARARLIPGRSATENPFETIPLAAYEQGVWRAPSLVGRNWLVNDPAGIKRVLIDRVANYPKMAMEQRAFRALFGEGLLSADGETWRTHRRIMAPSFDPRSVAGYSEAMVDASTAFAGEWGRLEDGAQIDASADMTRLTLEIISRTMFSADAGEMTGVAGLALEQALDQVFSFNLLDILPVIGPRRMTGRERLMRQMFAPMDEPLKRLIESRRANPGKLDLLGRLVAALDEETGAGLSTEEVRNEVLTIFVAGHETTAAAMTFVWYALSQQPEWEEKLHAELGRVLGGRTPTDDDLPNLKLTRRIIEETMRLYPPAPGMSARVAVEADEVAGTRIPAGGMVLISAWILHRHRSLWEDPNRFDPDRFLAERSVGRPRFAYLPFGGGPRVCIGQMLAMNEATLILATLAQRFRLRMVPGHQVAIQHRITIRPRGGLPMLISRR
jgi:cytochrome P450